MNTIDELVIAANGLMAAAAILACRYGALNDDPRRRWVWGSIAALSTFYSFGYVWLLMHPDAVVIWSRVLRGVSLATWPLVWIVPPILITRLHQRDISAVVGGEP